MNFCILVSQDSDRKLPQVKSVGSVLNGMGSETTEGITLVDCGLKLPNGIRPGKSEANICQRCSSLAVPHQSRSSIAKSDTVIVLDNNRNDRTGNTKRCFKEETAINGRASYDCLPVEDSCLDLSIKSETINNLVQFQQRYLQQQKRHSCYSENGSSKSLWSENRFQGSGRQKSSRGRYRYSNAMIAPSRRMLMANPELSRMHRYSIFEFLVSYKLL